MAFKKSVMVFVFFALLLSLSLNSAFAENVRMKVVMANPSATKTQTKAIKSFLPKEIRQQDIIDSGGLDINFDEEQSLFYVHKDEITLAPSEIKTFEVVLADVWIIPTEALTELRTRTENMMKRLKETNFFKQGELIAKTIYGRLDDIDKSQSDSSLTRKQHIAVFRSNQEILTTIKEDVEKLEKMLVTVGGTPTPQLLEKADINLQSPSTKTTWIIIFVVLIFVSILAGTFYFTWHRQASITENIFTKEKSNSFSEFKNAPPKTEDKDKK